MHWTRIFLITGLVFVPLIVLALHKGMDMGSVGIHVIAMVVLVFLIIAWTRRAIAEYKAGFILRAIFSAAVILFFLAVAYRVILNPFAPATSPENPKNIPAAHAPK